MSQHKIDEHSRTHDYLISTACLVILALSQ